jgi:hypothetical protein
MRNPSAILPAAGLVLTFGPAVVLSQDVGPIDPQTDYHGYANVGDVVMTHVYLHLDTDFVAEQLKGYVELDVKRVDPTANTLVLDCKALDIAAVELVTNAGLVATKWEMGTKDKTVGMPLTIDIGNEATKVLQSLAQPSIMLQRRMNLVDQRGHAARYQSAGGVQGVNRQGDRAPIGQNLDQFAGRKIIPHQIARHIDNPGTCKRSGT